MSCHLTLTLLTESQEGNIGNDWKYRLDVKVFSRGLVGKGKVQVDKHTLNSGNTQAPPGPPEPLDIDIGPCSGELKVNLSLTATEVDMFINDSGTIDQTLTLICPSDGAPPVTESIEMQVGVRESPGLANEVAVFTLTGELSLACD